MGISGVFGRKEREVLDVCLWVGVAAFVESRFMEMNVRRSAYRGVHAIPPVEPACVIS